MKPVAIRRTIIAAVAENGVIGRSGGLPWRLSTDLKRFKAMTLGRPVIIGRKTFESFGKALPGRPNIVVTRDADYRPADAQAAYSFDAAIAIAEELAAAAGVDEIFIAGGGDVYRQAMSGADRLLITHVEASPDGDTSFPGIDSGEWGIAEETCVPAGEKDNYPSRFVIYDRRHG